MARRSIGDVVMSLCRFPIDEHALGLSPNDLVRASGFPGVRSEVTAGLLATCLRAHPDWIEAWFRWSEDQRWSPAFYLVEVGDGAAELGYYEGPGSQPPEMFTYLADAAAQFAIRTLGPIADRLPQGPPSGPSG